MPYPIQPEWFLRPDGIDGSRGIHGIGHAQRVLVHAREIAEELGLAVWERECVELAGAWHDIGRTHDGGDYYHGGKSAGKVVGMGLHEGLDPFIVETALYAVTHHCGSEQHGVHAAAWLPDPEAALRVFKVLKDADGLDRVRLHDGVDLGFLRYEVSKNRLDRAWELLREWE